MPGTHVELVRAFFAGAPDDLVAAIEDPERVEQAREGLAPLLAPDFEFVTVSQSVGMPGKRKGVEGSSPHTGPTPRCGATDSTAWASSPGSGDNEASGLG